MLLHLFIKVILICQVISVPLEPGQPGGPWTSEEIDIVKEKVHTKSFYKVALDFNLEMGNSDF